MAAHIRFSQVPKAELSGWLWITTPDPFQEEPSELHWRKTVAGTLPHAELCLGAR